MVKIKTNEEARLFKEVTAPQGAVGASLNSNVYGSSVFKNIEFSDSGITTFYNGFTVLTINEIFANHDQVLFRPNEEISDESTARINHDIYNVLFDGTEKLVHENVQGTKVITLKDFFHLKVVSKFSRTIASEKCNLISITLEPVRGD